MTPRNLFLIILKASGIFFIKYIIDVIPQLLVLVSYSFSSGHLFFTLTLLGLYVLVALLLIFKSAKVIDRFKLDQGFTAEHLNFNLSLQSVLNIAIIVTGAVMLITEIPNFFRLLYFFFEGVNFGPGRGESGLTDSIFSLSKIVIALVLIGERKRIVAFIEERKHKETAGDTVEVIDEKTGE